jgi:hypothetical protein
MEIGPASGWLAAIVAVIALIFAVRTFRKAKREGDKRIAWAITSDAMVMPQRADARWERLVVKLGDDELSQPRVVTMNFTNVGQVELKTDDIAIPPTISIPDGDIRAATAEAKDHSGGPTRPLTVKIAGRSLSVDSLLLNAGDTVTFRLLIDKTKNDVIPSFQAAGFKFERNQIVAALRDEMRTERYTRIMVATAILAMVVSIVVLIQSFAITNAAREANELLQHEVLHK